MKGAFLVNVDAERIFVGEVKTFIDEERSKMQSRVSLPPEVEEMMSRNTVTSRLPFAESSGSLWDCTTPRGTFGLPTLRGSHR